MTQAQLDSFSYDISAIKEDVIVDGENVLTTYDDTICQSTQKITKKQKKKTEKPEMIEKGQNLIRKVEMNLDIDTDIHIYENKFKIIVKKHPPVYLHKTTWKLLLSKSKTINTASKLTEF
jgi:hypothetical protein